MSIVEEKADAAGGGPVRRRRRRWSEAQKRQIAAETHEPGVSVPMVAQRHNLNRAAVMYSLIGTAKLNDLDPQAWLADVLDRIADQPQTRLHELLPWHWKAGQYQAPAA